MLAALTVMLATVGCVGDDRPEVVTDEVEPGTVTQTVTAPARIDAAVRQDVATVVSGTVAEITAVDGARVVAGQPVVRLESSRVEAAQEQAAAAAQPPPATGVAVPQSGAATRAATADALAALAEAIEPELLEARNAAARIGDPLIRADVEEALDDVERAYHAARRSLESVGTALASQQDAITATLTTAINQALAVLAAPQQAQAGAAAAAARAGTDDLLLTAPFDGTVQLGDAAASEGAALPAGLDELAGPLAGVVAGAAGSGGGTLRVGAPVTAGQVLFTVFDLSAQVAVADVDEIDAPLVAYGQPATVTVDAVPGETLTGEVAHIAVAAARTEAGGVGYPVRIALDEASTPQGLRVGMTASVDIVVRTVEADLVVPSRALVRRGADTVVFTVRDGRARAVPVEVLALGEEEAAVAGELADRDRVVVDGFTDLQDGTAVREA